MFLRCACRATGLVRSSFARTSSSASSSSGGDGGNDGGEKDLAAVTDKGTGDKVTVFKKGPAAVRESLQEMKVLHRGGPEKQTLVKKMFHKPYETTYRANRPIKNPIKRTIDCLKFDRYKKTEFLKKGFDAYYDVCIIGGGIMGCSVAYHLATKVYKGLKICVVEKDSTVGDFFSSHSIF